MGWPASWGRTLEFCQDVWDLVLSYLRPNDEEVWPWKEEVATSHGNVPAEDSGSICSCGRWAHGFGFRDQERFLLRREVEYITQGSNRQPQARLDQAERLLSPIQFTGGGKCMMCTLRGCRWRTNRMEGYPTRADRKRHAPLCDRMTGSVAQCLREARALYPVPTDYYRVPGYRGPFSIEEGYPYAGGHHNGCDDPIGFFLARRIRWEFDKPSSAMAWASLDRMYPNRYYPCAEEMREPYWAVRDRNQWKRYEGRLPKGQRSGTYNLGGCKNQFREDMSAMIQIIESGGFQIVSEVQEMRRLIDGLARWNIAGRFGSDFDLYREG